MAAWLLPGQQAESRLIQTDSDLLRKRDKKERICSLFARKRQTELQIGWKGFRDKRKESNQVKLLELTQVPSLIGEFPLRVFLPVFTLTLGWAEKTQNYQVHKQ